VPLNTVPSSSTKMADLVNLTSVKKKEA
jgi:hypothetical protein